MTGIKGLRTKRPAKPPHELQWLWDGLAGKSCPVCLEALDNGTALIIEPGGLFRHVKCERVRLYYPPPAET